jgi:hypothetical protein
LFPEREIVKRVPDDLDDQPTYQDRFKFIPYAYEDSVPALTGTGAQIVVDDYLLRPEQADIFVCMMWLRIGTPTQDLIDPATQQPYHSGTEYEYLTAYHAFRATEGAAVRKPWPLLYRCERDPVDGWRDFMQDRANRDQYGLVEDFFKRFGAEGDLKGLYGKTDHSLMLWEVATGEARLTLTGHAGEINGCAVSLDRAQIVSVSADRTLREWDVATGQERARLTADAALLCCAVNPTEGRQMAAGDASGRVHFLWLER